MILEIVENMYRSLKAKSKFLNRYTDNSPLTIGLLLEYCKAPFTRSKFQPLLHPKKGSTHLSMVNHVTISHKPTREAPPPSIRVVCCFISNINQMCLPFRAFRDFNMVRIHPLFNSNLQMFGNNGTHSENATKIDLYIIYSGPNKFCDN